MGKKTALCLCLCIIVLSITIAYVKNRSTYSQKSEIVTESGSELMQAEASAESEIDNSDCQNPDGSGGQDLSAQDNIYFYDVPYQDENVTSVTDSVKSYAAKSVLADNIVLDGSLGTSSYPLLSDYGFRDNMGTAISTDHRGIDFGMDVSTDLCAPVDTVICYVGENDSRGKWLVMHIGNGLYLEYQHLSEVNVSPGDYVEAHSVICQSGDTGVSIMPHLHLEILVSPDGINDVTDFEEMSLRTDPNPYLGIDTSEFNYLNGI